MAERDEKVMQMVERRLKKNPDVSTQELYEKAKEVNSAIGKLTLRQFNARYPLQVKRKLAGDGKSKAKKRKASAKAKEKSAVDREAVRDALLGLVKDVADAESKGAMVDIVAGIDKYVDRVLKKL